MAAALARYVPANYFEELENQKRKHLAEEGKIDDIRLSQAEAFFPLVVAADILHVQLKKYGGPRPTLVAVGRDQYDFLNLAWGIIDAYITEVKPGLYYRPSFTYHGMLVGTNKKIMSRDHNFNAIFLKDSEETIRDKVKGSEDGKKSDGSRKPRACPVYEILRFHIKDDPNVFEFYEACENQARSCSDCKALVAEHIIRIVGEHQQHRREKEADVDVAKYMLEQDILRETESIVEITELVRKTTGR